MIDAFVSLVVPVGGAVDGDVVERFLERVGDVTARDFADYEVILVANGSDVAFDALDIDDEVRANTYLVHLARPVVWDRAALAGLERANGDVSVSFDVAMADHLDLVVRMHREFEAGRDVVNLRDRRRWGSGSWRRSLFFFALRLSGVGALHPRDRRQFLASRRALNWIVRGRAAHWYLNEAFLGSGFRIGVIEVDLPRAASPRSRAAASDLAWGVLARSPRFLRLFARTTILAFVAVLATVVLNALAVRLLGHDLLGQPQDVVPGWTYLVILVSAGLAGLGSMLYVVLMVQLVLLDEVRANARPPYVIERFGRL